nr:putative cysteine protease [Oceanusvirus sp.]
MVARGGKKRQSGRGGSGGKSVGGIAEALPRETRAATGVSGKNKCASDRDPTSCGSCFTMTELREIRDAYTKKTGEKVPGKSYCHLYSELLKRMSCTRDRCLINRIDVRSDLRNRLRDALVPVAPRDWLKDPTAWLSNIDIDAKVKELVRRKRYRFLGVQPMDFESVDPELASLDPVAVKNSSNPRLLMVMNTDFHDQPGSHWVGFAAYLKKTDPRYGFYYYDSNGNRPTRQVDAFVTRLTEALGDDPPPPYEYNDTVHQNTNTECGMFCISFIDTMINTPRSFPQMCGRMRDDAEMIRRRTVYFELPGGV